MKWLIEMMALIMNNDIKRLKINSDKDTIILYHADCLDGFGAAYAAWKHFGNEAEYIPVKYNEPAPIINDKTIYIVDFSYKADELNWLVNRDNKVIVIDHHPVLPELHASNIKSYAWDFKCSGAVMTWEYFHGTCPVPELLMHIQDRDLWQFKLENTKEICAALYSASVIRSFDSWDNLAKSWDAGIKGMLISIGSILLIELEDKVHKLANTAYPCSIDGVNGLAINAGMDVASELGNELARRSGTYGAVWTYLGAGKYKVGLRSIDDFDVNKITVNHGGGGHKNAAGFFVDKNRGEKLKLILKDLSDPTNSVEQAWQKPKLLVIGHAGHGKDTVCEILRDRFGYTFESSSHILAEELIFPKLKDLYGYESVEQCYADRGNHRKEWFDLLAEYNTPDATRLGKLIFSSHDIYCGLRNVNEFYAMCESELFDCCIWVDASKRLPSESPDSMTMTMYHADYVIYNNSTIEELKENVNGVANTLELIF